MQSILTVLKRGSQLLTDLMTVREELDVKRGRTNTLIREIKWSSLAIASACSRVLMQEKVKEEVRSFGHLDAQDYWLGHRIGPRSDGLQHGSGDPLVLNRYPIGKVERLIEWGVLAFGDAGPVGRLGRLEHPGGRGHNSDWHPAGQEEGCQWLGDRWPEDGDDCWPSGPGEIGGYRLREGWGFEVDYDRGFIYRLRYGLRSPWIFTKVLVIYTGGYTLPTPSMVATGIDDRTTLPGDLEKAALRLIEANILARGRDPALKQYSVPGVLEETFWVGAPIGPNGLPPEIENLLGNYRDVVV